MENEKRKTYKMGDIVDVAQGLAINSKTNHLIQDAGLPLLRITDLFNNTQIQFINPDEVPSQCIINDNELIYTRTGQVGYVFKDKTGVVHNNCFKVIPRDDVVDKDYLYWFLFQKTTRDYVNTIASGSAQKDLPHTAFKSIEIELPSIDTQRQIAKILSSLNDNIKVNQLINNTLKAIAQAIFREWFIENSGNYESGTIGNLISETTERNSSREQIRVFSAVNSGELLPSDEVFTKQVYSHDSSKYKKINKNNFAYNPARVNIGSIGILEHEKGLVSPVYTTFSVKPGFEWYLLFFIRLPQTKAIIEQLCSGSVRQNLTFDNFASIEIPIPTEGKLQEFNERWFDLRNMIKHNEIESRTLGSLRDSLLPKLMRGEVRVKL